MKPLTTCLWFDGQAEQAARFYTSVLPDSQMGVVAPYTNAGPGEPGSAMTVTFKLMDQDFMGLNGGPEFPFTEAVSFVVYCADQDEIDHYWETLSQGGEKGVCGWLKDRFGVSWQVVPTALGELMSGADPETATRIMQAVLQMKKLIIADLERAAAAE